MSSEPWRQAVARTEEFDRTAAAYDRYRPRWPDAVFDDIVELGGLAPGSTAIDVGAGTGIGSGPLAARGLDVTAVEPSEAMVGIGRASVGPGVRWVVATLEGADLAGPVDLVTSFNGWHWVEPRAGTDRVAALLRPGGSIALVWTVVVAWGDERFEAALAEAFGQPWPKDLPGVLESRRSIEDDARFGPFTERRHRFARDLDAEGFVAVTNTYGGADPERDAVLARLVGEAGGTVTKVEEAALYVATRR
jgi:SAM-dependent methyltransferase